MTIDPPARLDSVSQPKLLHDPYFLKKNTRNW